jgi:hypothetical protein
VRWLWRRLWQWLWRRTNGTGHIRAEAEAKQRAVQRQTPRYERELAEAMAALPPDEFADRVARMFGRHA